MNAAAAATRDRATLAAAGLGAASAGRAVAPQNLPVTFALVGSIDAARGFAPAADSRRPHVTPALSPCEWPANDCSLIRANTTGARGAYTVVDTRPLLDEA